MTTPRRPGSRGGSSAVITAIVRALAPRLPSTMARAAAPRLARRTPSPTRSTRHSPSSRRRRHLHGGAAAQELGRDLGEVVHVRPEHDGLAEHRRLEDVVAAGVDQAAADEDHAGDLVEPRQLADGVEDDDVGVGRLIDGQAGAADDAEALPRRPAASLPRSAPDGAARRSAARPASAPGRDGRPRTTPGPRPAACWRQSPPGGPATGGSSAARGPGSGRAGRRRASPANRT